MSEIQTSKRELETRSYIAQSDGLYIKWHNFQGANVARPLVAVSYVAVKFPLGMTIEWNLNMAENVNGE